MRNLSGTENVKEEVVQQWVNEYSKLQSYEVLSDQDILSHVTCRSNNRRN